MPSRQHKATNRIDLNAARYTCMSLTSLMYEAAGDEEASSSMAAAEREGPGPAVVYTGSETEALAASYLVA